MTRSPHPQDLPCACSALRQATRVVSRYYEACLAPTGTTATQYSILRYIQRHGTSPLRRIANALELERTSLYRALAPLERKGLVTLLDDESDARVKRAELTEEGTAKIQEARPRWLQAQESFVAAVGAAEWASVAEKLEALRMETAGISDARKRELSVRKRKAT